ncbi:MAG: emp24/gp25L/p24 family protein [Nitrosopumilaceae archaeon]
MVFKKLSTFGMAFLVISGLVFVGFLQASYSKEVETVSVPAGSMQSITFNLSNGAKFKGSLAVSGGSGNDINFWVSNPTGDHIVSKRGVTVGGNFQFTADEEGAYTLFFDNSFSIFSSKIVTVTYDIENPVLGGGCLIATAAFGSELAPQVQQLRETRDNIVMKTQSGATFMTAFNSVYYSFAPTVADWERQNPIFKEAVKITITPLLTTLSILNYVPIHSEAEMLGYGIGVILLNIGMYFVAPAFAIMRLKHH